MLEKKYELSIWKDTWKPQPSGQPVYEEERIAIIATDKMMSQHRAHQIKLLRKANGEVTLNFNLYASYVDMITGKEVHNPFVDIITNETKLKLHNGNDWYDLIVNKVDEDSSKHTYSYQAIDQHIHELSKNGFNLVLDQTLYNNSGSLPELAATILKDTDWEVDVANSNISYQTVEESLIALTIKETPKSFIYQVIDPNENTTYGSNNSILRQLKNNNNEKGRLFKPGDTIYAFYSSCKGKPYRFQFIRIEDAEDIIVDKDNIIINSNCQYVFDMDDPNDKGYQAVNGSGAEPATYFIPSWCEPTLTFEYDFRGKRYVFSQKSKYFSLAKNYLYECKARGSQWINTRFILNPQGTVRENKKSHYVYCHNGSPSANDGTYSINFKYNGEAGYSNNEPEVEQISQADSETFSVRCTLSKTYTDVTGTSSSSSMVYTFNDLWEDWLDIEDKAGQGFTPFQTFFIEGKEYYRIDYTTQPSDILPRASVILQPDLPENKYSPIRILTFNNDKITNIEFNNNYRDNVSCPIGSFSTRIATANWVRAGEGQEWTVNSYSPTPDANGIYGTITNSQNYTTNIYAYEKQTDLQGNEYDAYLIYRLLTHPNNKKAPQVSLSLQKENPGFSIVIDNMDAFAGDYSNIFNKDAYHFIVIEKDAILNTSNIWFDYSMDVLASKGEEGEYYIHTNEDTTCPYLTPIKDKINEVTLKIPVAYAPVYMLQETEYMTPNFLTNLCGNTDFNQTSGWTTGVLSKNQEALSASSYNPSRYKGAVEAGGAKDVFTEFSNAASSGSTYVFPAEPVKYLTYSSPLPILPTVGADVYPVLISSGPYSQRTKIRKLQPTEKYIALLRTTDKGRQMRGHRASNEGKMEIEVAYHPYLTDKGCYCETLNSQSFLQFNYNGQNAWNFFKIGGELMTYAECQAQSPVKFANEQIFDKYKYYAYSIVEVADHSLTEEEFQKLKVQVFCKYNWETRPGVTIEAEEPGIVEIQDLIIIPYVVDANNYIILPDSGVELFEPKQTYKYYEADSILSANVKDDFELIQEVKKQPDNYNFFPVHYDTAEQIRNISLKESNYFNGLSTLSETFKSWLKFNITRSNEGKVINKKVLFKNNAGVQTYAGFRYGANLKSVKRTIDSKDIVTKMIVKNNANVAGLNGFCSIARSPLNELGENFILNFEYYIRQNLISKTELQNIFYNLAAAGDDQLDLTELIGLEGLTQVQLDGKLQEIKNSPQSSWNCFGYATRLNTLNTYLTSYTEKADKYYLPLNKAISDLTVAEAGLSAAEDEIVTQANAFYDLTRYSITDAGFFGTDTTADSNGNNALDEAEVAALMENKEGRKIAYAWIEARVQKNEWINKVKDARDKKTQYENAYKKYETIINIFNECKSKINIAFFLLFGSFIKEGTWKEERYYDDNEYYIDAQATMFNSCFPKITYSINVQNLDWHNAYQYYHVDLGDKSYVEDPEFFGYNEDGSPYQEEIVISEVSEVLDNPVDKTLKVQNYRTQFQDLFQRITATVQQTKYAEGSYTKAANLANGSPVDKSSFVTEALNDKDFVIENSAQQTVKHTNEGIIITDEITKARLKLMGGAIYFSNDNLEAGEWKQAINAKGLSANIINAGQLNTENIVILNNGQPTFRWDGLGLTAYDFMAGSSGIVTSVNYGKGVRFDHFGIYGYDIGGTSSNNKYSFNPHTLSITNSEGLLNRNEVKFALTWDGLKIITHANPTEGAATCGQVLMGTIKHGRYQSYTHEDLTEYIVDISRRNDTLDADGHITNSSYAPVFTVKKDGTAAFYGNFTIFDNEVDANGNFKTLFEANQSNNSVKIGGWYVTSHGLECNPAIPSPSGEQQSNPSYAVLSAIGVEQNLPELTSEEGLSWRLIAGDKFGITTDGHLYAKNASIQGRVEANAGSIGSWFLNESHLTDANYSCIMSAGTGLNGIPIPNTSEYVRFGIIDKKSGQTYKYPMYLFLGAPDGSAEPNRIGFWEEPAEAETDGVETEIQNTATHALLTIKSENMHDKTGGGTKKIIDQPTALININNADDLYGDNCILYQVCKFTDKNMTFNKESEKWEESNWTVNSFFSTIQNCWQYTDADGKTSSTTTVWKDNEFEITFTNLSKEGMVATQKSTGIDFFTYKPPTGTSLLLATFSDPKLNFKPYEMSYLVPASIQLQIEVTDEYVANHKDEGIIKNYTYTMDAASSNLLVYPEQAESSIINGLCFHYSQSNPNPGEVQNWVWEKLTSLFKGNNSNIPEQTIKLVISFDTLLDKSPYDMSFDFYQPIERVAMTVKDGDPIEDYQGVEYTPVLSQTYKIYFAPFIHCGWGPGVIDFLVPYSGVATSAKEYAMYIGSEGFTHINSASIDYLTLNNRVQVNGNVTLKAALSGTINILQDSLKINYNKSAYSLDWIIEQCKKVENLTSS